MEIDYARCNVPARLKAEIVRATSVSFWETLTAETPAPADDLEAQESSARTRAFMARWLGLLTPEEIKPILVNVRHDLRRDDFDWAVRLFQAIGNLDRFAVALQKIGLDEVAAGLDRQETYYGQSVTREVLDYVNNIPDIFYGRRHGNVILAQAIPADVRAYLHAEDAPHRRRAACHCAYTRESILQAEGPVSPQFCNCSLGHTMALWEAVLDRKLEGEVVESALMGSDRCLFKIALPPDVLERWT